MFIVLPVKEHITTKTTPETFNKKDSPNFPPDYTLVLKCHRAFASAITLANNRTQKLKIYGFTEKAKNAIQYGTNVSIQ